MMIGHMRIRRKNGKLQGTTELYREGREVSSAGPLPQIVPAQMRRRANLLQYLQSWHREQLLASVMMACPKLQYDWSRGPRESSKPRQAEEMCQARGFRKNMYLLAGNSDDTKQRQKI